MGKMMVRVRNIVATIALIAAVGLAEDLVVNEIYKPTGCDLTSKSGDTLAMHYTGTLAENGNKFDSSLDRGEPFSFKLGAGQVIKGWDNGLQNMCVGEKRQLVIPPKYGYGDRGIGPIPGGATLKFEVELLKIN